MIDSDTPISSAKDDKLKREKLSRHIASYLCEIAKKPSTVLAIEGPWGSGKTSLINMTVEALKNRLDAPIIVDFNPWSCISTEQLVPNFLYALRDGLSKSLTTEKARAATNKALRAIEEYAAILSPVNIVAGFMGFPFFSTSSIEKSARSFKSAIASNWDIEACKMKISSTLKYSFENVVVVIDDIDRLPNERICLLFQLVAQIADFPHVHYLLAYDSAVVEEAVSEIQHDEGRRYLEKIVQLSIPIPELPRSAIVKVTQSFQQSILNRAGIDETHEEALRASTIMENAVIPNIKTIRDFKRYCNALEFEAAFVDKSMSISDLVGITGLKLFFPEILPWIDSHINIVCGAPSNSYLASQAAENKQQLISELSKLAESDRDVESAIGTLFELFPKLADSCGSQTANMTEPEFRIKGRIASKEIYINYRRGSLETWKYPREEIQRLINEGTCAEIGHALDNEIAGEFDFSEEVSGLIKDISSTRAQVIACAVLNCMGTSTTTEETNYSGDIYERLLRKLFQKSGKHNSSELLKKMIAHSTAEGLVRISHLINTEELAHGRLAGEQERPDKQLFELDDLISIEELFASRIRELSPNQNLFEISGNNMLMYLWTCFDQNAATEHLEKMLHEDDRTAVYVCQLYVGCWRSFNGVSRGAITGWSRSAGYPPFPRDSKIIDEPIRRLRDNGLFWDFDEYLQQAAAALYLLRASEDQNPNEKIKEIDQEDVVKLLEEWRKESVEQSHSS